MKINVSKLTTVLELVSVVKPSYVPSNDFYRFLEVLHEGNDLIDGQDYFLDTDNTKSLFVAELIEETLFSVQAIKYEDMITLKQFYTKYGVYEGLHTSYRNMQGGGKHFRAELCSLYGAGYLVPKTRYKSYGDTYEDARNEIKMREFNAAARLNNSNPANDRITLRSTGEQMYTEEFCLWFLKKMITDGTIKLTPELIHCICVKAKMTPELACVMLDVIGTQN